MILDAAAASGESGSGSGDDHEDELTEKFQMQIKQNKSDTDLESHAKTVEEQGRELEQDTSGSGSGDVEEESGDEDSEEEEASEASAKIVEKIVQSVAKAAKPREQSFETDDSSQKDESASNDTKGSSQLLTTVTRSVDDSDEDTLAKQKETSEAGANDATNVSKDVITQPPPFSRVIFTNLGYSRRLVPYDLYLAIYPCINLSILEQLLAR